MFLFPLFAASAPRVGAAVSRRALATEQAVRVRARALS